MGDFAVRLENLGKQYRIRGSRTQHKMLREVLWEKLTAPVTRVVEGLRRGSSAAIGSDETLWALKDVSLEIPQGEVVGVIGYNGAGKSTLLKILSRITEPTEGRAEIRGRVGSLLEVGVGFHQELTGRENVYLSGAILGMRRGEIARKFDEIVSFAEVEKFVDMPVKHYSSGMYLRLAFAVAAHLEPEILLVDEVLAVGDIRFQRKCLGKMEDVGHEGRTVLFVSHNMGAVTRLCSRVILLEEGRKVLDGPADRVTNAYLSAGGTTTAVREWPDPERAPGGHIARLRAVRVRKADGAISGVVDVREAAALEMEFEVRESGHVLMPAFDVLNEQGVVAFGVVDQDPEWRRRPRPQGRYVSTAWIPPYLLREGTLYVDCFLAVLNSLTPQRANHQFAERNTVSFQVVDPAEGDSARGDWLGGMAGVVWPRLRWTTEFDDNGQGSGSA